jgi:hypothetical protein
LAVAIIAPGYAKAVSYIPVTSLAYVGYGWLLVVFRAGDFYKNRIRTYGVTASVAGGLTAVLALTLTHVIGVIGAPAGAAFSCFGTGTALLIMGHLSGRPMPLDYPRILGSFALAAACWVLGTRVGNPHGALLVAVRLLALAAFPVGLVALHIIPRDAARQLPAMLRAILPKRKQPTDLIERVGSLPFAQRDALIATAADHLQPSAAAARLGVDENAVLRSVAAGLRRLAGGGGEFLHDDHLAHYLVTDDTPADRNEMLRNARGRGANMLEFRAMERIYLTLQKAPRKAWTDALLARYDLRSSVAEAEPSSFLDHLARAGWDVGAAAREQSLPEREVRARVIAELRRLSSSGPAGPADQLIGQFLLDARPDLTSRQLWAAGVDPLELHRLDLVLRAVRIRSEQISAKRSLLALPVPALMRQLGPGEAAAPPAPTLAQMAQTSGEKMS